MAAKKGHGLYLVFTDIAAEVEEEFNRWYNEEHLPELMTIPGLLNAARYQAVQGGPKYLACYELAEPEVWSSEAWQSHTKSPTEWSQRMAPSVIGQNYIRNLYRLIYPDPVPEETAQADMAPALLVGRMSMPAELEERWNHAYNTERLPMCKSIPDYIRARRFEAVMGQPKYVTVHEIQSVKVSESPEMRAWTAMQTPVWSEVRPKMVHESGSPGVYTRIFP